MASHSLSRSRNLHWRGIVIQNVEIKKTMKILSTIVDSLSQNSTWRGLILIATAAGVNLSPELQAQIIAAGLGLVGLINVIRKGK
jgi:hypothetical protein